MPKNEELEVSEGVVEEPKKKVKAEKEVSGFYKGYDMRWLKTEPTHPDFYLVAEYEKERGEVK